MSQANTPTDRSAAAAWLDWMQRTEGHSRTTLARLCGTSTSVVDRAIEEDATVAARSWVRIVDAHEAWRTSAEPHVRPPAVSPGPYDVSKLLPAAAAELVAKTPGFGQILVIGYGGAEEAVYTATWGRSQADKRYAAIAGRQLASVIANAPTSLDQALATAARVTASVDPLSEPASDDRDTEH